MNDLAKICLLALLLSGVPSGSAVCEDQPLNVLLITADDLGMQLNCYGDDTVATPNLNSLASRSVQFRTAYVAQASCSSSRSAMLTGTFPHTNGQYGLANAKVGFRAQSRYIENSIPNTLKRSGYRTAVVGKLHVDPEREFDFDLVSKEGFGSRDVRKQVATAKSFWRDAADEPWFLMFNVFDPHVAGKRPPGQPAFPAVVKGIPETPIGPNDVQPWPWQGVDTPATRKRIAGYYNSVARVDAAVGMLMEALENAGQRQRTLIIFLGDHGPPFSRGKTTCYEAGLRVPFLLRWPGQTEPHQSDRLVSAVDIAPTVFDAIGVAAPDHLQGRSLRPIAKAASDASWRTHLVGEFHFHGSSFFCPTRAITNGRYKLIKRLVQFRGSPIVSVDGDPANRELKKLPSEQPANDWFARVKTPPMAELYDLQSDPNEKINRIDDESLANVVRALENKLDDWQAATEDPFSDAKFCNQVAKRYLRSPR